MIDENTPDFQPVNMVEKQLVAAAIGNSDQQKAFEKFILDETLYFATPEVHPEGNITLQVDTSIQLLNATLDDGRQAAAVFTSPQRVGETFGEVGYMGLQGRTLFEMIRAKPAVLNPGQTYCVVWEPSAMAAMLGLPMERTIQKDTKIMLGLPADPPTEVIERLKLEFISIPDVAAAWLALAVWPETQEQSWYFDVRTDSTDHEVIRRALSVAIEGADLKGRPVDMVINAASSADGIGIVVVEPSRAVMPKKGFLRSLFG
jgi:SseB protein C-terminal domain/SseB protein N-terminal domain